MVSSGIVINIISSSKARRLDRTPYLSAFRHCRCVPVNILISRKRERFRERYLTKY